MDRFSKTFKALLGRRRHQRRIQEFIARLNAMDQFVFPVGQHLTLPEVVDRRERMFSAIDELRLEVRAYIKQNHDLHGEHLAHWDAIGYCVEHQGIVMNYNSVSHNPPWQKGLSQFNGILAVMKAERTEYDRQMEAEDARIVLLCTIIAAIALPMLIATWYVPEADMLRHFRPKAVLWARMAMTAGIVLVLGTIVSPQRRGVLAGLLLGVLALIVAFMDLG